jgi:aminoglycoside phosphotransferase (APT) family kinase protein
MSEHERFVTVARRVAPGAELVRWWRLTGGVRARVHGLELALPEGGTRQLVVRQPANGASAMASEVALLKHLRQGGAPVPAPILVETSAGVLGGPYYVMPLVAGSTVIEPARVEDALMKMAAFLARVHTLDVARCPPLPAREDPIAGALEYLPSTPLGRELRDALAASPAWVSKNPPALLHGDYWYQNILWRDGEIAAVLDWEDAAIGDPLCDLAAARHELLWYLGEDAMERFTSHYLSLVAPDLTDLPLWELFVSSAAATFMGQWGLPPEVEATRRRQTDGFIEHAGRRLLASLHDR